MRPFLWLVCLSAVSAAAADEVVSFQAPPGAKPEDVQKCVEALAARCSTWGRGLKVTASKDEPGVIAVEVTNAWADAVVEEMFDEESEAEWLKAGWTKENWKVGSACQILRALALVPCKTIEVFSIRSLTEEEHKRYKPGPPEKPGSGSAPLGAFWCPSSKMFSPDGTVHLLTRGPVVPSGEIRKIGMLKERTEYVEAFKDKQPDGDDDPDGWWYFELSAKATTKVRATIDPKNEDKSDGLIWVIDGEACTPSIMTISEIREYFLAGKEGRSAILSGGRSAATIALMRHPLPLTLKAVDEDK